MTNNKKSFIYKGKTIYYFIKDIEFKEMYAKEMAKAMMVICDEKDYQKDLLQIYDEKDKVIYAMPDDALR